MAPPTQDQRITGVRPLISPAILLEEIAISEVASILVADMRQMSGRVLDGDDWRLAVIVGPCSIDDPAACLEYPHRKVTAGRYRRELVGVLRCYFQEPRTTIVCKGLISDNDLGGSFGKLGLPTALEFLDTHISKCIDVLTLWAAVGARTIESQVHRELASEPSMPVGFGNRTDGNVQPAAAAVYIAATKTRSRGALHRGVGRVPHRGQSHLSRNPEGRLAQRGPAQVQEIGKPLADRHFRARLIVGCSHGNSLKDHRRQLEVATSVGIQVSAGSRGILGVMLESQPVEGRQ